MKTLKALPLLAVFILFAFSATAAVSYVDLNSTNPTPPYADWSTAATNIQDAIDAASIGDLILVTNGVYNTGGTLAEDGNNSRVSVTKSVTLQSVNGAVLTKIDGGNVMRCVYLTNGAALTGFTLMNGSTAGNGGGLLCSSSGAFVSDCSIINNTSYAGNGGGGGAWGGSLSNSVITGNSCPSANGGGANNCTLNSCIISNNSAPTLYGRGGGTFNCNLNFCRVLNNYSSSGGGVAGGVLKNCIIANNGASDGGGVFGGYGFIGLTYISATLYNCVIVGNYVSDGRGDGAGGGVYGVGGWATLYNCIIYYNYQKLTPGQSSNNYGNPTYYCCSPGAPGLMGITGDPLFVNRSAGDFHLQANSRCINSGNISYDSGTNDLDGNPRIIGGTVDIGAYEYQTPASMLSYSWAQQYGLPTDGSADNADADGDGMNNWQEWKSGTNPTNALSLLKINSVSNSIASAKVTWQSVANVTYFLQRSTDLSAFTSLHSNIVGQAGSTSYTDTTATDSGSYFYRVGVQ